MSALIRPRRLTSQPQYPAQVDTGNPIARGLINLYSRGFDAATNRIIPASDGAQLVSTSRGMALPLGGTNYAELTSTIGSTGSVTYVAEFMATVGSGSGQDDIIALGDRCTLRANTFNGRVEFYTYNGVDWNEETTGDGTFVLNVPAVAVAVHDLVAGTNQIYLYQAGVLLRSASTAASPRSTGAHPLRIGLDDETSRSLQGMVSLAGVFNRALTDAEARSLVVNPWQLLKAQAASRYGAFSVQEPAPVVTRFSRGRITRRRSSIFDYSAAGWFDSLVTSTAAAFDHDLASSTTGRTGTASVTLAAATLAATGTLPLSGQASRTLGNVTLAATGTVALTGAAAPTLAAATLAATGTVALSATASVTLAALTPTATATLALAGASAQTLAPVTSVATGTLALAGAEATTLAALTSSATGTVALSGTSAVTLAAATLAATGTLALAGTEASTLAAATLSAAGAVALAGSSAVTLDAVTAAATGTLSIGAAASVTLDPVTTAATGTLPIVGATAATLDTLTSAATGALALTGTATPTLADATLLAEGEGSQNVGAAAILLADLTAAAAGTLPIVADAAVTLGAATSVATGTIALAGASALTLADATLSATATLALAGADATQLADATLNATAVLALVAAEATTLDDLTLSATGELTPFGGIVGTAAITFGDLSVSAASTIAIAGATGSTLAALSLSAAGHVDIAAALGITLGDLTLSATAAVALTGSAAVTLADLTLLAAGTLTTHATRLSAQHAAWLEGIVRLHGLVDPLAVGPTLRGDGTVVQSIGNVGGVVTLTTLAAPSGAIEDSALTIEQAGWLEALARLHGLIDPLVVDAVGRGDGTVQQAISTSGDTVLVERLS